MSRLFLALAAVVGCGLTVPVAAASGQAAAVTVHRGIIGPSSRFAIAGRSRGYRHGGFGDASVYLDREYQGDTAWRPSSFNDWWHDNPERNSPRWLQSNNCSRQYWTGAGWRC